MGTVGFSYSEWISNFYPRGTPAAERLAFYARHFNAVEIDTTFHAIPSRDTVRRWASVTPPSFRFCVKAPRQVTHGPATPNQLFKGATQNRPDYLLQASTLETMGRFFNAIEELEDKLAVVLLQFPHTFTAERRATLTSFLDRLPRVFRLAIEFRHGSWWTPEMALILRQRGISWVAADQAPQDEAADAPIPKQRALYVRSMVPTTDFLYVRWLGRHGQFLDQGAEQIDPAGRLTWWYQRLQHVHTVSSTIRDVYCFFDNDFSGHAPTTARRFSDLLGLPRPTQFTGALDQPTLFGSQSV